MAHIRIVDIPCGYGKSSRIVSNFDKREKYVAVVPYLSEVDRFIAEARQNSDFFLTQPQTRDGSKSDHAEKLIRSGKSVVCTHSLFYRLGTLATQPMEQATAVDFSADGKPTVTTQHLLADYNFIIDEVVEPFSLEPTVRIADFDEDYIGLGLAEVKPNGMVHPTPLWDARYQQGNRTFRRDLYEKAKSGALFKMSDNLFVLTMPVELLTKPKSVTFYTYMSEGSLLLKFMEKLRAEHPGLFTLEVERLPEAAEAAWRRDVASALTVKSVPSLAGQALNYRAQLKGIKTHRQCASVGHKLRRLQTEELHGVNLNSVMLTCARDLWYRSNTAQKPVAGRLASHTRLFGRPVRENSYSEEHETYEAAWSTTGAQFVPNTTRGTNKYSDCTHAIYLYDQHPNPQFLTFLGMERSADEARRFVDAYALTELVQWLFRSAIRKGGVNGTSLPYRPRSNVCVYLPSGRMRNLLLNWLLSGRVCSGEVRPADQRQEELLARVTGQPPRMAA